MALIGRMELPSGLVVDNAYLKIDTISGTKLGLTFQLFGYISIEAYQAGKDPLFFTGYSFTPRVEEGAANFIEQAYEHLKTLPLFSGATDA